MKIFKKIESKIRKIRDKYWGCSYFYDIPFEFPKPLPPSSLDVLKKGCEILKKMNIDFCVSYGTLLGIYRDNSLIPHDSDIDIEIVHPVNVKKIEEEFVKNGFKVCAKVTALGKVQQLAFSTVDEVVFDISFYEKIGSDVYCFHDPQLYFKLPAVFYEKFLPYDFNGYTVFTPNTPENWLEFIYGKNWKTPKSSKPEDWHEEEDEYGMTVRIDGKMAKEIKKIKKNAKNME